MASATKPPKSFLAASQARLERVKSLKQERVDQSRDVEPLTNSLPSKAEKTQLTKNELSVDQPVQTSNSSPSKLNSSPSKSNSSPSKSKTLLEIERIREGRKSRRVAADKVKVERVGKDELDVQLEQYTAFIDDFRSKWSRQASSSSPPRGVQWRSDEYIKVFVRKRPIGESEKAKRCFDVVTMATAGDTRSHVYVHEPRTALDQSRSIFTHQYKFDCVFNDQTGNDHVYQATLKGLMEELFDEQGLTVSLFCYGATGSGKTYTIFGLSGGKSSATISNNAKQQTTGLYFYACHDIFRLLKLNSSFSAKVSFFEIYSGKAYDLFHERVPLRIMEDKNGCTQIAGLSEHEVTSFTQCQQLMMQGNASRTTGATNANATSSRSHAIFKIMLGKLSTTNTTSTLHSTLCLIDLAGSERGRDVGPNASQVRRTEGAEINKSLLSLKECIRALHKKSAHVPFRASKLTQILRDSFATAIDSGIVKGKRKKECKCLMIVNISPSSGDVENTLGGLHYANRVKELQVRDADSNEQLDVKDMSTNNIEELALPEEENETFTSEPDIFYSTDNLHADEIDEMSEIDAVDSNSVNDSSEILGDITEGDQMRDEQQSSSPSENEDNSLLLRDFSIDEQEMINYENESPSKPPEKLNPKQQNNENTEARGRRRTISNSHPPPPPHPLTQTDISQLSNTTLNNSLLDFEDYLIEKHIATLNSLVDYAKEEELLLEQRLKQQIDMDVYLTAAEAALNGKINVLVNLSKELKQGRDILTHMEDRHT